jgi:hypothetical protein
LEDRRTSRKREDNCNLLETYKVSNYVIQRGGMTRKVEGDHDTRVHGEGPHHAEDDVE